MNPILAPGTIVRTKAGNLRTIDRHKPESDRVHFGRAYWFTSRTWDHESEFTVVNQTQLAKVLVTIPSEIAKAIEMIREVRIESADEILFMDVLHGRNTQSGDIRRAAYILHRYAKESISNRKKYIQAITDGYERDLTPREKIVKGIQDGSMDRDTVFTVLEAMGHTKGLAAHIRKNLDDDAAGACALV